MQRSFRLFKQNFFQAVDECRPATKFNSGITNIICSYCALGTEYMKQFHENDGVAIQSTDEKAKNLETKHSESKHPETKNSKIKYDEEKDLEWSERIMYFIHEQITMYDDGLPLNWDRFAIEFAQQGYIHSLSLIFDHKKSDPHAYFVKVQQVAGADHNLSHSTHYLFEALHAEQFGVCYMLLTDYPFPDPEKFKEYAGKSCGWGVPPDENGHQWWSRPVLSECMELNNVTMATFLLEQKASPDLPRYVMNLERPKEMMVISEEFKTKINEECDNFVKSVMVQPLFYAASRRNNQWTTMFYKYSEKKFSASSEKYFIEYCLIPENKKYLDHIKEEIANEFKRKMLGSNSVSSFFQWFGSDYDKAKLIARAVQNAPNIQTIKNIIDSQIAFLEGRMYEAFEVVGWVSFPEVDPAAKKRDLTHCALYKLLNSIKLNLLSTNLNPHAAASAGPGPGPK